MNKVKARNQKITKRKARTRAKISGSLELPRLSVFRSNKYSYVQAIDDASGKTLVAVSTKDLSGKSTKIDQCAVIGETLAKKLLEKGIKAAVFDRGAYNYHGRVKAIAEGARKGGLKI